MSAHEIALTHSPSTRLAECELTFRTRAPIDFATAQLQHTEYRNVLQQAGLQVINMEFNQRYADGCFVEDVAVVLDEVILLGSMGVAARRGEVVQWRPVLGRYREVVELPPNATLEGGDCLRIGRYLLVGHSSRTNSIAIEAMEAECRRLGYRLIAIDVMGCLHLKTACSLVDLDTLLVNPRWINQRQLPPLRQIVAPEDWGANIARLPDRLLASKASPATIDLLNDAGFDVQAVDIGEFEKAEAGVTCLSLLL